MTVQQFYENVILPFYTGRIIVVEEGKIIYEGFAESRIHGYIMIRDMKKFYCTYDEELAIMV